MVEVAARPYRPAEGHHASGLQVVMQRGVHHGVDVARIAHGLDARFSKRARLAQGPLHLLAGNTARDLLHPLG